MRATPGGGRRGCCPKALLAAAACAGFAALAPVTAIANTAQAGLTPPGVTAAAVAPTPPTPPPADVPAVDVARVKSAADAVVDSATTTAGDVAPSVGEAAASRPAPASGDPADAPAASPSDAGTGGADAARAPARVRRQSQGVQARRQHARPRPVRRPRHGRRSRSEGSRDARVRRAPAIRDRKAPVSHGPGRPAHAAPRHKRGVVAGLSGAIDGVLGHVPDWSRPIIAILLLLVAALGLRAFFSGRRARALERDGRALSADVEALQAALVPSLPERIGDVELSVAYRAADGLASGGDFYEVFALDGTRTAIVLGDVSGHDRAAIARAAAVRHKLRAYLELGLEPRNVLRAAGEALASDSEEGEFATAVVAVHDSRDETLTYACAGHPPPILTGPAAHDPVLVSSSAPLGWGLPTGRRQTSVVLADHGGACFFTDGLTEARADGAFLEREGLERLVDGLGATGTADDLIDAVIGVAPEAGDDLAALIIRTAAPAAEPSVRVELVELDADEVARRAPERFLAACDAPAGLIERLAERARAAVADNGRVVMRVRIDAPTSAVDAHITPVHAAVPRAIELSIP